jgi:hypothetical protein
MLLVTCILSCQSKCVFNILIVHIQKVLPVGIQKQHVFWTTGSIYFTCKNNTAVTHTMCAATKFFAYVAYVAGRKFLTLKQKETKMGIAIFHVAVSALNAWNFHWVK